MRIAYFDCISGIAGDMVLGALVDAGLPVEVLTGLVHDLGLADCQIRVERVKRCGFAACAVHVEHKEQRSHRHLKDIQALLDASALEPAVAERASQVFQRLAAAEAKVHGTSIERVHFHEVGAIDSIVDIVGAVVGLAHLGIERIDCSPVPTGTGSITIAHGRVSIPAPATAELLTGVPLVESSVEAELTTPTGAALVATLAGRFGPLPAMTIERIGYGAGDRDLVDQPNVLRLVIGTAESPSGDDLATHERDQVVVMETNLDDCPANIVGFAMERLWAAGALDVYATPIQMKKNRAAIKLTALCHEAQAAALEQILFAETGTLGVRRWTAERTILVREADVVSTPWGAVAGKRYRLPDGTRRFAPEYESCRQVAAQHGVALWQVYQAATAAGL
jgi:uncharacterized protein (TIGR00299 family) protein